jgi:outer membrane protein assembly factor BamB
MKSISVAAALLCLFNASGADWPQWRGPNRDGKSSEEIKWPDGGPKVIWKASVGTGFSSVSVSQGRIYTMGNADEKDTIWCLDARTGKPIWQHSYDAALNPQYYEGGPGSTPTVHGNKVFTISKWGDVFCLDAVKGTVL